MRPESRYCLAEHRVDSVLEMLRGRSEGPLLPGSDSLLKRALDDLAGAMEELRAAHEEVDAQREELDKACREGQREHQRYVELFENAPDGYVVTDLHGVILQANRAAVELLNSARDSLVGKPLALFVNEEDKTAYFQKLNEMDVIESVRDWELRFQPWKGKPFWTSISIAKVQISEHEDVSLRWLIRDITGRLSLKLAETVLAASERKRLEEALCESEERLRLFVEHAPASLAMFDVEMRYLGFSRRWLSDYNLGDRDLRGLSHYDVFPEIPGYWKEVHRQALAGEVLRAESDRFERADGAVQWLRWEVRPWGNAAGKIGGIVVFSEDITESKRAEDAVRRSEAMLRAVVDQMPSGVTVRDASTGALVLSNVRILEMMGDLVDTLDQLPRYGGSHPDGRPYQTHEWPLSRSLATGEVVDAEEIECERSDGTRITLSVSSAPVRDLQGQITHGVGVFHDITQQKTAKNKLKADTEQLESFNKELEQFFFIATHDLQEPLRKIQTFGNRLGTICKDSIPDEGQAHLKRINNAAKRMSELLSALLAYSRISASPMQIEHTNLTGVAQKAIDKLRTSIDQAGARVELNQLPGLNADPGQIQEIFGLLIGNSLKFRGEQGSPIIKISARMIGDACEISIEDNGIGFDEIYLDKIFTPFQQLHGRGKYEGTGMGLSVCRKIAERHGGRITARGTPGVGATFILTLPLRQNTGTSRSDVTSNGGEDAQRLIHELRVHQIELEMQNEELRNLQVQIEESRSRYADLYDFAPVGYLSCDRGGLILEANLTAATQLGVERSRLIDKPLWLYVLKDDREVIHAHFRNVLDTRERQTCEVRLQAKDGPEFYARLESIFIRDAKGMGRCRTSVIDISGSRIAGEAPH